MTVILGKNNSGKSSFLRALAFPKKANPHSNRSNPLVRSAGDTHLLIARFSFDRADREFLAKHLPDGLYPHRYGPINEKGEIPTTNPFDVMSISDWKKSVSERILGLQVSLSRGHRQVTSDMEVDFTKPNTGREKLSWNVSSDRIEPDRQVAEYGLEFERSFANAWINRVYEFRVERYEDSRAQISADQTLALNSSNLAAVLNALHGHGGPIWENYLAFVREVLPGIDRLSFELLDGQKVELQVVESGLQKDEWDRSQMLPLDKCGTGVGRVLSLLYLATVQREPSFIIIDEPSSFLHPDAARKLIRILRERTRHQYVIASHSASVVRDADPECLLYCSKNDGQSIVTRIEQGGVRSALAELGVRLSDVMGTDDVLWVEGPTEEECLPIIMRHFGLLGHGTAVLGVVNTGDFEGTNAELAFRVYERLSRPHIFLPPALGFLFDRESRTKKSMDDLIRESKGRVHFLEKRLYEDYLLVPDAIHALLVERLEEEVPNLRAVETWLSENAGTLDYQPTKKIRQLESGNPLIPDGAKLIMGAVKHLSEFRMEYDKIVDGAWLTRWLLEHRPEHFNDIVAFLRWVNETRSVEA